MLYVRDRACSWLSQICFRLHLLPIKHMAHKLFTHMLLRTIMCSFRSASVCTTHADMDSQLHEFSSSEGHSNATHSACHAAAAMKGSTCYAGFRISTSGDIASRQHCQHGIAGCADTVRQKHSHLRRPCRRAPCLCAHMRYVSW